MLGESDFEKIIRDENGDIVDIIDTEEVFMSENQEVEHDESYYKAEYYPKDIDVDSTEELLIESKNGFNNIKEQIVNKCIDMINKGYWTGEDNETLKILREQYYSYYNSIRKIDKDGQVKFIKEELQKIKSTMVKATKEDILNILTDNGTKCWIYKDDDGNVLLDIQSIPQLTILLNQLFLIAADEDGESSIKLTPKLIELISTTIVLTAEHIILDGYVSQSGGNFKLDNQGNMEVQDLNVIGDFSCESLNFENIGNAKYPSVLDGSMTIYVNETNGDDESKLNEGSIFKSLSGAFKKIPKNLNGKTLNIVLQTDLIGNISIEYFMTGKINIFFNGHTLYGYYKKRFNYAKITCYGGTIDDYTCKIGTIYPSVGYGTINISYSVFNSASPCTYMYSMKIVGATNLASGCSNSAAIGCSDNGYIYTSSIAIANNVDYGFRTETEGKIYNNDSTGVAKKYGFCAVRGGEISLSNLIHCGGKTQDTYENSGGEVRKHDATFDSNEITVEPPTISSPTDEQTVTYSSTSGDTYRTTFNSWRKAGLVVEGNGSIYGAGVNRGYWFFGNQFNELKGYDISKIVLKIKRAKLGTWGSQGTLKLAYHEYSEKPTTPTSLTYFKSITIPAWDDTYHSFTITDSNVLAGIKNGTIKGFGLYDDTGAYIGCSSSAKVTITYS